MNMDVELEELGEFILEYIFVYRNFYERFTSKPPEGVNYPKLNVSLFLNCTVLNIYLGKDGVIISEETQGPSENWYMAGGPAIKIDTEPTKTPVFVSNFIKDKILPGDNIGIYRIVAKQDLKDSTWSGKIEFVTEEVFLQDKDINVKLCLKKIAMTVREILERLTFGALGLIPKIDIPDEASAIGDSFVIKNMGFFPADLNNKRFFSYLQIHGHVDKAAWDKRAINIRVQTDLRRDFANTVSSQGREEGGVISWQLSKKIDEFVSNLRIAITEFGNLLQNENNQLEEAFHLLLKKHPILLDVYGYKFDSKPRLTYPKGTKSAIGKAYVEPDFIISYSNQTYKLVELERDSKGVATVQGQPRAELNQAAFQIAEWKMYIKEHYQEIREAYPGIHSNYKTRLIISRSKPENFKGRDFNDYISLIKTTYSVDEVLTYDNLYEEACQAYISFIGLSLD